MKTEYANFLYQLKFALQSTDPVKQLEVFESVRLQYNKLSKKSSSTFIRNLSELFIELQQMPACNFLEGLELEHPILTSYYRLNPVIDDLLTQRDEYEAHQALMGELVKQIRQHPQLSMDEKEEIYTSIRKFICTNYLTNYELIEKHIHVSFVDVICDLYTEVDLHDDCLTLCPHCTRPILKDGLCTDVCNFYQKKSPLPLIEKEINPKERYFALSDGVYQFTNLPSIGERYIFKKLNNQFLMREDLSIKMYPKVDQMDLVVSDGEIQLELDIKDYINPLGLVSYFEREGFQAFKLGSQTDTCKRYLVIPDHRVFIYNQDRTNDYMSELRNGFKAIDLNLQVVQERELKHLILKYFDLTV